MKQLFCTIQIEILKYKRTYALALAILAPLFITLLYTVIFFLKGPELVKPGENGVPDMLNNSIGYAAGILFPLYLILLAVFIHQIEHKTSSLKDLFSFPVTYFNTYISKWVICFMLLLLSLILYYLFSMLGAWIVSLRYPELFSIEPMIFSDFAIQVAKTFICSLFMLAIQFIISLKWSEVIIPFGAGLVGFISGLILLQGWDYIHFHPYVLGYISFLIPKGDFEVSTTQLLCYSMAGFIFLFGAGYFVWSRRRIA